MENGLNGENFVYEVIDQDFIRVSTDAASNDATLDAFKSAFFTVNNSQLVGVTGSGTSDPDIDPPFYKLTLGNLNDSDLDGIPDLLDYNKTFWETGTILTNDWRDTNTASIANRGIGYVWERNWPWVYAFNMFGGSWMYIYNSDVAEPDGFWAYCNAQEIWLYFYLKLGRWYWDHTANNNQGQWIAFNP